MVVVKLSFDVIDLKNYRSDSVTKMKRLDLSVGIYSLHFASRETPPPRFFHQSTFKFLVLDIR